MLTIQVLKTPEGYYLGCSILRLNPNYFPHRINGGVEVRESYCKDWYFCPELPHSIEQKGADKKIITQYTLIDPSLAQETIPVDFKPAEVESSESCCDGGMEWRQEFKHLRSLYKPVEETIPGEWNPVEFTLKMIGEYESLERIGSWSFPKQVHYTGDRQPVQTFVTHNDVDYYIADKVSAPDIVLGSRPCALTREQTFQIIREHAKRNLDRRYAKVSSDYDFSFAVDKIIKLATPEEYTVDVNAYSSRKRKPKYEKRYRHSREIKVLNIKPNEREKWGHVVGRFQGKDLADLKETIDRTLAEIMEELNEPLVDCPACRGAGVIRESSVQKKVIELGETNTGT